MTSPRVRSSAITPSISRKKRDDDGDYVDSRSNGKPSTSRPGYQSARAEVSKRQGLTLSPNRKHLQFTSFDGKTTHKLDLKGREWIAQKPKNGKPRPPLKRQPALDHVVQYIALKQGHDELVTAERAEAAQGRPRRNSVDLADAFRKAVANPDNLRLVMHDEHAAHGGHKTRDNLTKKEISNAKKMLNRHWSPTPSTMSQSVFDQNRPKWHTPLPELASTDSVRKSARLQHEAPEFKEMGGPTKRVKIAAPPPLFVFTPSAGNLFTTGKNSKVKQRAFQK